MVAFGPLKFPYRIIGRGADAFLHQHHVDIRFKTDTVISKRRVRIRPVPQRDLTIGLSNAADDLVRIFGTDRSSVHDRIINGLGKRCVSDHFEVPVIQKVIHDILGGARSQFCKVRNAYVRLLRDNMIDRDTHGLSHQNVPERIAGFRPFGCVEENPPVTIVPAIIFEAEEITFLKLAVSALFRCKHFQITKIPVGRFRDPLIQKSLGRKF